MYTTAIYDWSSTKSVWTGNDFCPPGKWMVICNVNWPYCRGFRRYFDDEESALAFARTWIDCQHDRSGYES